MRSQGLDHFGGYAKAMELFDLVVQDMRAIRHDPLAFKLVSQQVASADSIAANIEEGHGRLSRSDYVRFLDYARASARETRGRYIRMQSWFPETLLRARTELCDEILGILTAAISTLRSQDYRSGHDQVREDSASYSSATDCAPLAPRPSTLLSGFDYA